MAPTLVHPGLLLDGFNGMSNVESEKLFSAKLCQRGFFWIGKLCVHMSLQLSSFKTCTLFCKVLSIGGFSKV